MQPKCELKIFLQGGGVAGAHSTMDSTLASLPAAPGSILSVPKIFFGISWCWWDLSTAGHSLETMDSANKCLIVEETHLVLASGKLVLQNKEKNPRFARHRYQFESASRRMTSVSSTGRSSVHCSFSAPTNNLPRKLTPDIFDLSLTHTRPRSNSLPTSPVSYWHVGAMTIVQNINLLAKYQSFLKSSFCVFLSLFCLRQYS